MEGKPNTNEEHRMIDADALIIRLEQSDDLDKKDAATLIKMLIRASGRKE